VNQSTPLHQRPVHGPLTSALETIEINRAGREKENLAYPVQVIRLDNSLTIVALGSEVVIDYALRLKSELTEEAGPDVWVAGYSNLYDGYIPSRRVQSEGGYESEDRPWDATIEERIVSKVHELADRLKNAGDSRTGVQN
jgi:hypothetical protein